MLGTGIPRVTSIVSAASFSINTNTTDLYVVTGLSQSLTVNSPTGSFVTGQKIMYSITSNGSVSSLTFSSGTYGHNPGIQFGLPTASIVNTTQYLGFIFNSSRSVWDFIAYRY